MKRNVSTGLQVRDSTTPSQATLGRGFSREGSELLGGNTPYSVNPTKAENANGDVYQPLPWDQRAGGFAGRPRGGER